MAVNDTYTILEDYFSDMSPRVVSLTHYFLF